MTLIGNTGLLNQLDVTGEIIQASSASRGVELAPEEFTALIGLVNGLYFGGPEHRELDELRFSIVDARRRFELGLEVSERHVLLHGLMQELRPRVNSNS